MLELLPDVQIFHNAVRYALNYDEFYKTNQTQVARDFLKQGHERAQSLREGKAPWTTATGLIVRGYVSKIDGSVQPYGLVVPASYQAGSGRAHRLDLWFHGRGETLTELDFINGRQKSPGEFTPPDAFVLHLYGRYCNGNKFAGEVDVFEALDDVRKHYPIDENRLVVRGFSLGGAACWHIAVHYAGLWAAAAPGAGFSETPDFLKVFQKETLAPTWYEKKLWHLYDCTDYAVNLFNCPTVAYSGEIDSQKQAADIMGKALAAGRNRNGPHHRAENRSQLSPRFQKGNQPPHRQHRGARTQSRSRPRSLHDLDAALQPDELGDGGRPGTTLGTRSCRCHARQRQQQRESDHEECFRVDVRTLLQGFGRSTSRARRKSRSTDTKQLGRACFPTARGRRISARMENVGRP